MSTTSRLKLPSFLRRDRKRPSGSLISRLRVIVAFFLVGLVLLGLRLIDLQVVRADTLAETAIQFRSRTYAIPAERGEILDANGHVLAVSRERYNVAVNQHLVESYVRRDEDGAIIGRGAPAAASVLASILDMDEARLAGILHGGETKQSWVYLAKDVSPEVWRQINSYGIPGIEPEQLMRREYPNGRVGASILGFVGEDDEGGRRGQAGIERSMDETLTGVDGSMTVEISRSGAVIPTGRTIEEPAEHGSSVTLTVDVDLQFALDEALERSVSEQGAEWGSAIAIEVGTGRVLALSDTHTFDPENPQAGGSIGSRAIQSPVEPGSSGKLMTFAAAFDQGQVSATSVFPTASVLTMPNGETIRDNEPHPAENLTVAGILAKSYNTGLIQIGDTVPDDVRFDYMQAFGLGQRTGIELPAESPGIFADYSTWGPRERYTTMFGQAYALTTAQLGQMVATIANGGVRTDLHIVDSVTLPDGSVEPTIIDEPARVVTEDTADQMLGIMQAVTENGSTGYYARIDGYNVAGKTGTAQMPDGSGGLTHRVGTFAGVVPADDPQIAIAVVVYNGKGPGYGSETAAPVFGEFGAFAVRHLGISPSPVPLVQYPWSEAELQHSSANGLLSDNGSYRELVDR
ncbi:penicillin-binding transpeptidase domain-containing protein [Flaviflexus huanghaiensis]|uniref:penicillin-binding transpeptidase domain-containing protein n=1 Tax=Flaviflexus huanghaiensis TaxID=1111473 RepID=UPI0015FA3401